jgi:hypothetical protein
VDLGCDTNNYGGIGKRWSLRDFFILVNCSADVRYRKSVPISTDEGGGGRWWVFGVWGHGDTLKKYQIKGRDVSTTVRGVFCRVPPPPHLRQVISVMVLLMHSEIEYRKCMLLVLLYC